MSKTKAILSAATKAATKLTGRVSAPTTSSSYPRALSDSNFPWQRESEIPVKDIIGSAMIRLESREKPIPGIPSPSTYRGNIADVVEANALNPEDVRKGFEELKHNQEKEDPSKLWELTSKAAALDSDGALVAASIDEVRKSSLIITPGLNGGSSNNIAENNFHYLQTLFPEVKGIFYVPKLEARQRTRYFNGAMPYIEENFVNREESENFFEKILRPKFFTEDGHLRESDDCKRFIMLSHSIGARESGLHTRYLAEKLLESGCRKEDLDKYLNKILCLNVASPMPGRIQDAITPTIYFISLSDCGSKKPDSFLRSIFFNSDLHQNELTILTSDGDNSTKSVVVLGPRMIPISFRKKSGKEDTDAYGHSAGLYAAGIKQNEKTNALLLECTSFLQPDLSDEEALSRIRNISNGAQKYPNHLLMTTEESIEGAESFMSTVREYTFEREEAFSKQRSKPATTPTLAGAIALSEKQNRAKNDIQIPG